MSSRAYLRRALRACACAILLGTPALAAAGEPPSLHDDAVAGTIGPSLADALALHADAIRRSAGPEPATLRVSAFAVEGNVGFSDAALARVLAPFTGRALTLEELREAVETLLAHYRAYGYLATRISLPPQRIEQGVVRLVVHDGALAPGALHDIDLALSEPAAPAGSAAAAETEEVSPESLSPPAARSAVSRRFYGALPSSRPRATLVETGRQAADRLVVDVEEGSARAVGAESDLFARLPAGGWQVGATLQVANPAGRGASLTARGATDGTGTPFFSGRFDTPLDATGSTLAAPGRYLDEERVAELKGLHADGRSTSFELAAERPLFDRRDFDLSLRARVRHLQRVDQAEGRTLADRRIDSAQLGTHGRLRDDLFGGGVTGAGLSATLGLNDLGGFEPYARADSAGPRTAGAFARFRASLARLQSLGGPWSLFGAVLAQGASRNLDGSQQVSIGGLSPERGFGVGEAYGDEGFRVSADLRYAVPAPVLGGALQFALFYDQGDLRRRKVPAPGEDNGVAHRSLGLSLRQDWGGQGFVHLSAGRRIGGDLGRGESPEADRPYRFWLRVGMNF